jgi:hypothetical protein
MTSSSSNSGSGSPRPPQAEPLIIPPPQSSTVSAVSSSGSRASSSSGGIIPASSSLNPSQISSHSSGSNPSASIISSHSSGSPSATSSGNSSASGSSVQSSGSGGSHSSSGSSGSTGGNQYCPAGSAPVVPAAAFTGDSPTSQASCGCGTSQGLTPPSLYSLNSGGGSPITPLMQLRSSADPCNSGGGSCGCGGGSCGSSGGPASPILATPLSAGAGAVNFATGNLSLPVASVDGGTFDATAVYTYNSLSTSSSPAGAGWSSLYDQKVTVLSSTSACKRTVLPAPGAGHGPLR